MDEMTLLEFGRKSQWMLHELIAFCRGERPNYPQADTPEILAVRNDIERAVRAGVLGCVDTKGAMQRYGLHEVASFFDVAEAIAWGRHMYPQRFPEQLTAIPFKPQRSSPGPAVRNTEVTENERGSLLRLVLGMAIDAYKYEVDSARNAATGSNAGSIASALERLGLKMDQATVRKYLREAAERYPDVRPHRT